MPATYELGEPIPNAEHAVSVSLPTWESNIGYEEGQSWVVSKMMTGYPRFFIHKSIAMLANGIVDLYGKSGQTAMLFPMHSSAQRCLEFITTMSSVPPPVSSLYIVDLVLDTTKPIAPVLSQLNPAISAVVMDEHLWPVAKQYWQHSGDGISSRRAEFSSALLHKGLFKVESQQSIAPVSVTSSSTSSSAPCPSAPVSCRGPRRYQTRQASIDKIDRAGRKSPGAASGGSSPKSVADESAQATESFHFLEERFGRNLDLSLVSCARSAIRRRIAGAVAETSTAEPSPIGNVRGVKNLHEDDVFLFPCGMNGIFNVHRALLTARGPLRSVNLGFSYVDTAKILQKFGPGCQFYGHGSEEELVDLETRLKSGERFLALFCEFPGNPLLACPDLKRIRALADQYEFAIVIDETIGTFVNVEVLKFADVVVSSLTKIFSGESNVTGGSVILNPGSPMYKLLKSTISSQYEDTYWPEDIIFMERNSRDFRSRIFRANDNALALCDLLRSHHLVKDVFYPKYNTTKDNYEACRLPDGGYGSLLSIVFHDRNKAIVFYDALKTAKGPSLGTNFTLTSPYALLAHYQELDWAAKYGVDPDLVRISVGLEDTKELISTFQEALNILGES
ncbi:Cystathionine gamma-synthase [Ceratocystis lukuohia]|uniref:Cystathionine gamma-synthase n=1 Tax=Ceratocystis lukuohia TaxID=2019550 RepID=A0ABR4ML84_9PEZI